MGYFQALGSGLSHLADPAALMVLAGGALLGVFVGVVPGLGGIVLLVVLLPFLYHISPVIGLALLLGSHSAIYYAGSTTAILINTPGAPESAATCIDGHAMTRNGHVGRALGISAAATTYGGWFGALAILVAIPIMVPLTTLFHPPEYFFLTLLAVALIGQLQASSPTKGILSGLLGFLLSFVGAAASTGSLRFTFGLLGLYNGVNIAAAAIGLFAISQMFILFGAGRSITGRAEFRLSRAVWADVRVGVMDAVRHLWLATRSAVIGVLCGVIPGIGSTAANFLSYGYAMRSSKTPERFGTGIPEGIIAPEGSSISKEAGALIPTVALGVPNGPAMAVLLAAFSIMGLTPGPTMVTQHLNLVFWMVVILAVSSLLASVLGLALAPILAQITVIPGRVLVGFVLVLASIGTFAATTYRTQVVIMLGMGVVGLLLRKYGYSLPGVIVGLVLGSTAEDNLILTQKIYQWRFFERPLTDVIIAAIIAVIVFGGRARRRARGAEGEGSPAQAEAGQGSAAEAAPASGRDAQPSPLGPAGGVAALRRIGRGRVRTGWGELIVDLVWVVGSAAYVIQGSHYPAPANLGPVLLGGAAFIVAALQLLGRFVPGLSRVTHGTMPDLGTAPGAPVSPPPGRGREGPGGPAVPGMAVAGALGGTGEALAGGPGSEPSLLPGPRAEPAAVAEEAAPQPEREPGWLHRSEAVRQTVGIGMAAVLIGAIYLLGYLVATPVWTFCYFLFVRRWKIYTSLIAAGAVLGAFYLISFMLPSVIFPPGLI